MYGQNVQFLIVSAGGMLKKEEGVIRKGVLERGGGRYVDWIEHFTEHLERL